MHMRLKLEKKPVFRNVKTTHALRKKDTCIECKQKVECAHCHMPSSSVFKRLSSTNFFFAGGGVSGQCVKAYERSIHHGL